MHSIIENRAFKTSQGEADPFIEKEDDLLATEDVFGSGENRFEFICLCVRRFVCMCLSLFVCVCVASFGLLKQTHTHSEDAEDWGE